MSVFSIFIYTRLLHTLTLPLDTDIDYFAQYTPAGCKESTGTGLDCEHTTDGCTSTRH